MKSEHLDALSRPASRQSGESAPREGHIPFEDHDIIPAECSTHVAQAIPGARLAILNECGHFSYHERPYEFHKEITEFVHEV